MLSALLDDNELPEAQLLEGINRSDRLLPEGAMEVHVLGKPKYITKKILKEATEYFSTILLTPRLSKNIICEVHCVKDLYKKCDVWGEVATDFDYDRRKHREFKIFMEPTMGVKRMLLTLAHEMVHVQQYATGKLFEYDRKPSRVRWNGEVMLEDEIDYWYSPWEIEARGLEEALYNDYLNRKLSK